VIDEATCIKSMTGKKAKAVKRLAKRIPFRYALTGTPIENRPEELYSIMEAVDPTVLDEPQIFDSTFIVRNSYGKVKRYRNLPLLHELISEAMVRKSREDIAEFLPKITRQIIDVDFDRASLDLYIEIADDLIDLIATAMKGGDFDVFAHYGRADPDGSQQMRGDIMAKLVLLRMLCDDPQLLVRSAERYIELAKLSAEQHGLDEDGELIKRPTQGSEEAAKLYLAGRLDRIKGARAPKLEVCVELIEELLDEDPHNKVVVFSSFKGNLRSMQERLAKAPGTKGYSSVLFHGEMNDKQRDAAKQRFANDPNCKVFLSSDAGGYGVNLPNANYLISLDLPWSAGKLDQRESRIDRLSSEFDKITLITMMMEGSVENRQYDMLQEKRSIAGAVIDGKHDREGNLVLNLSTLKDFLIASVDELRYQRDYATAA
jgi:SNF2 family DNA or RNA helicase